MPAKDHDVDYTVCVDAKAVCLAFRQREGKAYKRLCNGDFKIVLGPRAAHGSKQTKAVPAGPISVYQDLIDNDFIHKEIPLWKDAAEIKQRYFSAGHLAFAYVNDEWPGADIHMFGFDSLFTGYQSSYSDQLRGTMVTLPKRNRKDHTIDNPVNTVGEWYGVWEAILTSDRKTCKSITMHGFEGDTFGDFFNHHMAIQTYPKDKAAEADRDAKLFPTA